MPSGDKEPLLDAGVSFFGLSLGDFLISFSQSAIFLLGSGAITLEGRGCVSLFLSKYCCDFLNLSNLFFVILFTYK